MVLERSESNASGLYLPQIVHCSLSFSVSYGTAW